MGAGLHETLLQILTDSTTKLVPFENMQFINPSTYLIEKFEDLSNAPPYATFSHTWGNRKLTLKDSRVSHPALLFKACKGGVVVAAPGVKSLHFELIRGEEFESRTHITHHCWRHTDVSIFTSMRSENSMPRHQVASV